MLTVLAAVISLDYNRRNTTTFIYVCKESYQCIWQSSTLNTSGNVAQKGNGVWSQTSQKDKRYLWPCQRSLLLLLSEKRLKRQVCVPEAIPSLSLLPTFFSLTSSQAHWPSSPLQVSNRIRNEPAFLQRSVLLTIQIHILSSCWRRDREREEQSHSVWLLVLSNWCLLQINFKLRRETESAHEEGQYIWKRF